MKKLTKVRVINWHYLNNETVEINGNTLLTGSNGTGKSTLLDAITYVLTAGDTVFNLAANDKGKRDLRSYVKCKLGIDDKEYLRNGDVSAHIALEFYDERTNTYFTVGSVIDAFGDLSPVKSLFYKANEPINDTFFISDENTIYSTVEFRKHNPSFEYYLVKKEAKRAFRNAFGSINEDFYRLIPKALAFKPIADVKDFIYQNILEEKQIDVTAIQESIRAYKELENTLRVIQSKISDLKEIDIIYQEIIKIEENKDYIEYLMKLFDVEKIKSNISDYKIKIAKYEEIKKIRENDLRELDLENQSLQERARDIYNMLSQDDGYKADEYVKREILRTKSEIEMLESNKASFLRRISGFKDVINELRRLSNEGLYNEASSINLSLINNQQVEEAKIRLTDFNNRLKQLRDKKNQELGKLQIEMSKLIEQINQISVTVRNFGQNKLNYRPELLALRSEIQEGLKRIYNYDVNVHIFAELCEVTDPSWQDTIEIFLGNRRFNLIVEPRYFDQALQIFSRIKDRYRIYGIGLINTKQISKYTKYDQNSLASIIDSENEDARCYINYSCGNVIMVGSALELEKYPNSITKDGLIYRGFTVTNLNPNIDKPFMGKNAVTKALEEWKIKAENAKSEYVELNSKLEALQKEVELLDQIDVRPLLTDLDNALELEKQKGVLEDLENHSKKAKNSTPSELEDDYAKIQETIKANDNKKISLSMEIGSIDANIKSVYRSIDEENAHLDGLNKELKALAKDNPLIVERAKAEYQEAMRSKSAFDAYIARFKEEESVFQSLVDSLTQKQYAYINKYNSTLSIGLSEMRTFLAELNKLEKSELVSYEKKVRQARESAEVVFKEDFIAKLRYNILAAEKEIGKVNETLAGIKFGGDKYEFIFPRSSEYAKFYEMVTSDLADVNQGLFTFEFQAKYDEQITELFESLSQDELNSNGALNKFTDYRTYMDYDIRITNENGDTKTFSKISKVTSGGETQVPFYVAIIASFVRVYQKGNSLASDPIGLVLFDEVFDKMDGNRINAMMDFITSMPLQIMIACPPDKVDILQPHVSTTLITVRQGNKAQIINIKRK